MGCMNITWVGLSPVFLFGVLRWVRRALLKVSVSRLQVVETFDLSILLALLTPSSAHWLECGDWAEDSLCLTSESFRNLLVADAVYSGPLSEAISKLMPKVVRWVLRAEMSPWPPSFFPTLYTDNQAEYLLTMMGNFLPYMVS